MEKKNEYRKATSITIPVYLIELYKADGLVLSHFVEAALIDYYNVKTKDSAEIVKEKQKLIDDLKSLDASKKAYLKEMESKKAKIEFKIAQLEDKEKIVIEDEKENDIYRKISQFLNDNEYTPLKQFNESAKDFIDSENLKIDVNLLLDLKNGKKYDIDTIKEMIE